MHPHACTLQAQQWGHALALHILLLLCTDLACWLRWNSVSPVQLCFTAECLNRHACAHAHVSAISEELLKTAPLSSCGALWLPKQACARAQVSAISEELLKTEYDAVRIIYNRFYSAISFKPTIATVLRRAPSPLKLLAMSQPVPPSSPELPTS
jgi:hypothetical protein